MALTETIDNYPGYPDGVEGFTLAQTMQAQAERFGAKTVYAEVTKMELAGSPKTLTTSEGVFTARTVVLAMGANPRTLGLPEESELIGRGVAYCAACDGMFYKGKTVVVVGGGNTAAADALLLSRIAEKVHLVHRRDTLRATKIYHEPLEKAENVQFHWNSTVTAIRHGDTVTGVQLRDTATGAVTELPCDAVFVSIAAAARHRAGPGPAGPRPGRLYPGRRDHPHQPARRLRRGGPAHQTHAPGGHGGGGRRGGRPDGRGIPGGTAVKREPDPSGSGSLRYGVMGEQAPPCVPVPLFELRRSSSVQ